VTTVRYVDALLDVALTDDLETEFAVEGLLHADDEMVAMLLAHLGIHIGSADAGAHITQFAGAGDSTYLLEHKRNNGARVTASDSETVPLLKPNGR